MYCGCDDRSYLEPATTKCGWQVAPGWMELCSTHHPYRRPRGTRPEPGSTERIGTHAIITSTIDSIHVPALPHLFLRFVDFQLAPYL